MIFILGYWENILLQYNTLLFKSLGSVKFFKEVSYAQQGCNLSIWYKILNIISQINIVKYYYN